MSDSFRKAWEVVGLPLANTFMDIIDSTVGILENLSEKFIYVWDHGGSYLFESLIKLGGKIFELSGYIYNNFVAPFVNWFINIMAPAISPLMDAIGRLFDKFSETIDWLLNDGKPVLDTIVSLVGGAAGLVGAFKAAKKGIEIFDGIKSSAERLGKAFINLDPKALLIKLAIAAIIGIGIYLISHWNEIKAKCKEVWDKVQQKFQEFKNWLGSVFATDWSKQFGGFGDILNAFLKNVGNIFKSVKEIFKGIIDFVTGVFTGDWKKAWNGVVKVFGGVMRGLESVVKSPLNAVIGLVNAAISGLNKISVSIPDWVPGFGGKKFGFNIPKIPLLAKGGIIDSPTLAMVGEAGKEAVMPLENNTGWITDLANKVAANMPRNSSNETYPTGNIIVQVGNDTLGKILLSDLKKIERQTGQAVIKV
jgi:phage-related protein